MPVFEGIIPPLITPLTKDRRLDVEALDRLVHHVIEGGVSGIFVLGTTGEGPSLSKDIKRAVVSRCCLVSTVPVLVNVTECSLTESLELLDHAARCGAAGVVSAAPFYFSISQADAVQWFQALADASTLPLLLYNMPSCVGLDLELETVRELSNHQNIAGIKDSSGNIESFKELCEAFRDTDFAIMMGPEELISEAVQAGACGAICGGANLLPSVYVRLFHACKENKLDQVRKWKMVVDQVFVGVYQDEKSEMNLIGGLKCAMEASGLCSRTVAPPLPCASREHRELIYKHLPAILQSAESALRFSAP